VPPPLETARYFQSQKDLDAHKKTKVYKNMLRRLKDVPYSQSEADAAAGMGPPDNGRSSSRKQKQAEAAPEETAMAEDETHS